MGRVDFRNFHFCLTHCEVGYPSKFQSVFKKGFWKVEDILQLHFFLHDFDFLDWELVCQLARWGIGKCDEIFKFLRYNNHIFWVNKIYAILENSWCSVFATFFSKPGNLEHPLVSCSERVKLFLSRDHLGDTGDTHWRNRCVQDILWRWQKTVHELVDFWFWVSLR